MSKKERILDAMLDLMKEGKAGTASVSDIAQKAGIAKGGLYYYFSSKEEVLDALVDRQYSAIIAHCEAVIKQSNDTALNKLKLLMTEYQSSYMEDSLDAELHLQNNAAVHQKSLAKILVSMSSIIANIIEQGVHDKIFKCDYPMEFAEIIMSVFSFLMDYGLFDWTIAQKMDKLKALAELLEKGLECPKGSFAFFYVSGK